MIETGRFISGENELSYSLSRLEDSDKKFGVLFVHAAGGNRFGPHRMFVELGEKFSRLGYSTFRFDFTGCGDSSGVEPKDDIDAEVFDLMNAVRFFVDAGELEKVILLGISRGARVCFNAMSSESLALGGMILLSTPVSTRRSAAKSVGFRLSEYARKLRDRRYFLKLIRGRVNIGGIFHTLTNAFALRNRYSDVNNGKFRSCCRILLIYGDCDPISQESSRYYISRFEENDVPFESHFISHANHSFFHYKWKEQIAEICLEWFEKIVSKRSI
ncbi:MAG: alpha/beta fold hydrolase [Planctomycetota bacterium]